MAYRGYQGGGQMNPWQNEMGGSGGLLPHPGAGGGVNPLALVSNLVGAMLSGQQGIMQQQQQRIGPQMGMRGDQVGQAFKLSHSYLSILWGGGGYRRDP